MYWLYATRRLVHRTYSRSDIRSFGEKLNRADSEGCGDCPFAHQFLESSPPRSVRERRLDRASGSAGRGGQITGSGTSVAFPK